MALVTNPQKRHLYFHPNSFEVSTQKFRDKYKLLIYIVPKLDLYIYAVGTSKPWNKDDKRTLEVDGTCWEVIDSKHSKLQGTGYYSWNNLVDHNCIFCISNFDDAATLNLEVFNKFMALEDHQKIPVHAYSARKEKLAKIASSSTFEISAELASRLGI